MSFDLAARAERATPGAFVSPRSHAPARADSSASACSSSDFEAEVRPHLAAMMRIARSFLHSDDLAQDAVQDVLLSVWKRGGLPPEPGPWLQALTRFTSRHVRRSLRRRQHHEERVGLLGAAGEEPSPVLTCQLHDTCRVLQEALELLAPEHREVLVRHELSGLSYQAVAAELDVPVGTVRSRLHRARARLRDVLARRLFDDGETAGELTS